MENPRVQLGGSAIHAGIDCSSKAVHVTVIDDDSSVVVCYKFTAEGKTAKDRFPDIAKGLGVLPNLVKGATVAIEKPLYFRNPHSTISISEVVGAVKEVLELGSIFYKVVDNKTWKKEVVGTGSASKEDILKYANGYFNTEFEEQDWADAACIAKWSQENAQETWVDTT